jgi:hypothetical protein
MIVLLSIQILTLRRRASCHMSPYKRNKAIKDVPVNGLQILTDFFENDNYRTVGRK